MGEQTLHVNFPHFVAGMQHETSDPKDTHKRKTPFTPPFKSISNLNVPNRVLFLFVCFIFHKQSVGIYRCWASPRLGEVIAPTACSLNYLRKVFYWFSSGVASSQPFAMQTVGGRTSTQTRFHARRYRNTVWEGITRVFAVKHLHDAGALRAHRPRPVASLLHESVHLGFSQTFPSADLHPRLSPMDH